MIKEELHTLCVPIGRVVNNQIIDEGFVFLTMFYNLN